MSYIDGFLVAVPTANKEQYRVHAEGAAPTFHRLGAGRLVEAWGDDVPDGKITDFRRAVKATPEETVVFSWVEYPSKQARQHVGDQMSNDPEMQALSTSMPFDAQRMIYGGFEVLLDEGARGAAGYVDGLVAPTSVGREDYRRRARELAQVLRGQGATRVVDAWGEDVPPGKVTDFYGAVQAAEGEGIVFSWIEWPSKAVRDAAWGKIMSDDLMTGELAVDGRRMIHGGFAPIVDV
jgi:uncharacterized protein YbaA (DUF1428 family)